MIYVLVPAHNEAPTVGLLLWKVRQLFTSFNREYHLIVVNDGSSDATEETLAPYTRALPMTLLTHRRRQGYARSLEALLREAVRRTDRPRRDFALTLQADFSESPDEALELIKRLEGGADIVVADRRGRAGASRIERLARRFLPRLVRGRLGITGAADVVGTMRGYRLAVIERLVRSAGDRPILGHDGWAADLELLARAARHARRVDSVTLRGRRPASARPSRLHPLREAWRAFRASSLLRGLPLPAPADIEAAEPAEPRIELAPRAGSDRSRRQGERGGDRREDRSRRGDRRQRREGRDERPRSERQPRGERRKKSAQAARTPPAEGPAAAPARESVESVPVDANRAADPAATPPGEGNRRKRRRRGRGRGRGRGRAGTPGTEQPPAEGRPAPPPNAPPPAA